VLECFIETAKIALKGRKKKFEYILSDGSRQLMEIDGDEFAESDYGLVIDNSQGSQELSQKLDMLAQAALQTQTLSFSTITKLYTSSSLAEKQRLIERDERAIQERQAQAQQQQLESQQQIAQMQQQQAQMWAGNMNTQYQQNVSIWLDARKAEIEAEQDAVLEPLKYQETMWELEKTNADTKLDRIKQELETYNNLCKEEIQNSAPKFGLG
jgi:hypothetical protein